MVEIHIIYDIQYEYTPRVIMYKIYIGSIV